MHTTARRRAAACSFRQFPFPHARRWFHATRNTASDLTVGVGGQTVLSSLPEEEAQAEVAALQRAFPRCARLEAYQLEGVAAPTPATAQRLEALVRRDPWHLPSRLTLLRHAIAVGEGTRFRAAADAASALAEHVRGLVRNRAAMPPLDAHFVLGSAAEQLYEQARARLGPGGVASAATKALFASSAQLQRTARRLLLQVDQDDARGGGRDGLMALPYQHRAAWLDATRSEAVSSYAAGAREATRACVLELNAVPHEDSDEVASEARALAKALLRGLG